MAKQKQEFSLVSAIKAVTAAMAIESIPNPTTEQKNQIHEAKVKAANIINNSNFVTAAEHGDDSIETAHQVDEVLEGGGIDPVQLRRDGALAGAAVSVEVEQTNRAEETERQERAAEGDTEQDRIEQEIEESRLLEEIEETDNKDNEHE